MKDYLDFVKRFENLIKNAAQIKLGAVGLEGFSGNLKNVADSAEQPPRKKRVLIFSPHPDDESMIGSLAMRLNKECDFEVVNVAVTLGSNKERREGRKSELESACRFLGWRLIICGTEGFDDIKPDTKNRNPGHWQHCVDEVLKIIKSQNPAVILAPHIGDWNKTHIGTGLLVLEAIEKMGASFSGILAQTEYWGAMQHANLMIEVAPEILADQITAVSCHVKEVERNDYHLRLPSWMSDNVRRGGEIVGGQGARAPSFAFGVIYNILTFKDGRLEGAFDKGLFISKEESISKILRA